MVTNADFDVLGELELHLKPESNEHYILDSQGMAVNGINIVEHDKIAITYKQAKPLLYEFLKKHSSDERLTPVGHATKGDIRRVTDNLISDGSWNQFCTYHFIDTSVVLQYLRACGKMPMDCDGSVEAMSKYFDIKLPTDSKFHTAKYDTLMTVAIFQKMVEIGALTTTPTLKG